MPRLVKIPDCTYEVFAKIRGALLDHAPWAIRNDIYENETNTAFIFFEDSAYIPFRLKPFILSPPFDQEKINAALANVDEDLLLIKEAREEKEESTEIPMIAIGLDEEFEKELAELPEKIQENLRNWKRKQEESKK